MVWLVIVLIISFALAALGVYVAQNSNLTNRRNCVTAALQYAEGAAVIAVSDLNTAVTTNNASTLAAKLTSIPYAPYTLSSNLSTAASNVYTRTLAAGAPFSSQPVNIQIWVPNVSSPATAQVVASATVGPVTQTATVNAGVSFGFGAAIVSVNDGTTDTSANKSAGQAGNVAINGSGSGPLVVYGGTNALAVEANGRINLSSTNTSVVDVPSGTVSMTNYSAGTGIPDYTSQGTSNTLFDINRFIAVANATPNGYSPSTNNHFANITTFVAAATLHPSNSPLQGVIVVDVTSGANDLNLLNNSPVTGINVEGSLVFNFLGAGWDPVTSKIVINVPVNINPANLSALVATNPATYTSGYPPTYTDPTKNPVNINITNAVDPATGLRDFQNFTSSDDLPAMIYSIGVVDLHNELNISGAMFTPSYMEIENKANTTQYMRGELIMGNGIYYENNGTGKSIISYDANAVNNLATSGTAGKKVFVHYWQ